MKKIALTLLFFAAIFAAFPQNVTLVFTGEDIHGDYVQLDSVVVTNVTRGWTETLYWPDTVLEMQVQVGIDDATIETMCTSSLWLEQNNPNPFNGVTDVTLHVVDAGAVTLEMTDMNGRTIAVVEPHGRAALQQSGTHNFRITVANAGTHVLTAHQNGKTSSIKMVNNGRGNENRIEYIGTAVEPHGRAALRNENTKGSCINPCYFGDQMNFILYATMNGILVTSELMKQLVDGTYEVTSPFAVEQGLLDGLPCQGTSIVLDADNNTYHTVLIGNQCWLKENMKTTKYMDGSLIPNDKASGVWWCYPDNNPDNKEIYGLLYSWPAMMNGDSASETNPSGVQGICPNGWHVPSEAEWQQLQNYLNSRNKYRCGNQHSTAKSLASTIGWANSKYICAPGNTPEFNNATGFSALPAGSIGEGTQWHNGEAIGGFGGEADFMSTTIWDNKPVTPRVICWREYFELWAAQSLGVPSSVRCLRD